MADVRNIPTPEGRALGQELARLCENELATTGEPDTRCKSCAFRPGTFPNGCVPTVMDAIKCVIEAKPFLCHEVRGEVHLCGGFGMMMSADSKTATAPWDFSK